MPVESCAYAALAGDQPLTPFKYNCKTLGPKDVQIKVMYCGVCHSDIHQAKNEWGRSNFPMVPGHEVVGIVEEVGKDVTKVKKGEKAGVGCMVGSCRVCENCKEGEEQYCLNGMIPTYNGKYQDGTPTYGGYGTMIVADEHFVLRWPEKLDMCAGAPLLCAGVTVYSPIKHFGLDKPGLKVGVVGLGGLGHMAVKFLRAFGVHTAVFSRSAAKKEEALDVLKADAYVATGDEEQFAAAKGTLDGVIDTVSATKPLAPYLDLLKRDGRYVFVGVPPEPFELRTPQLIFGRKSVAGSLIGGIPETQEMLDFCAEKDVVCMIEKIECSKINEAYDRVVKGDVRYRFVLDVANTAPAL